LRPESEIRAKIRELDDYVSQEKIQADSEIKIGLAFFRDALIWALDKPIK